jgi:hypothetical protein
MGMQNIVFAWAGINLSGLKGQRLFIMSTESFMTLYSVYGVSKEMPHIISMITFYTKKITMPILFLSLFIQKN